MANIALGQAIYMAFKPLLKIYFSASLGFWMQKIGMLTPEGSRIISLMVLNFLLPCLIFSNIVGYIKDSDAKFLGILVLSSYIYFAIGAIWGFFIRGTSPIPRAWFGGLLLACIINNSGDLPIAYIQTLGTNPNFPSDSTSRGTAFCVLYSIGFTSFLFNFSGKNLVLWDGKNSRPDRYEPTVPIVSWQWIKSLFKVSAKSTEKKTVSSASELPTSLSGDSASRVGQGPSEPVLALYQTPQRPRPASLNSYTTACTRNSFISEIESHMDFDEVNGTTDVASFSCSRLRSRSEEDTDEKGRSFRAKLRSFRARVRKRWVTAKHKNLATEFLFTFFENLTSPQALALIISILVALVPWLRRLFVIDPAQHVSGTWNDAPDGSPALEFVMDFTKFMGSAQVPMGLFLLGATIARLRFGGLVKGFWKTLVSIAIYKLVLLPIFAVFWISRLQKLGWISEADSMIVVVLAAGSGTPPATVQIYLTLLSTNDPEDPLVQLKCFGACLIVMYCLLPITMTILMTYCIKNLM